MVAWSEPESLGIELDETFVFLITVLLVIAVDPILLELQGVSTTHCDLMRCRKQASTRDNNLQFVL